MEAGQLNGQYCLTKFQIQNIFSAEASNFKGVAKHIESQEKMGIWKLLFLICIITSFVEAKWYHHQKRETKINICEPVYNSTNIVQCYCVKDNKDPEIVRSADCYLTKEGIYPDDSSWDTFNTLKNANKLVLTNTRGITLKYIPTNAFKQMDSLLKLDIKYGNIEKVEEFAFANLSFVEEISLRDDQIKVLGKNAFAHHRDLVTLNLDTNNIAEINRDVFVDLPSLEKLYLTSNKITTIHDRAFINLINLKELEIDRNALFSLNSETFSGLHKLQKLDLSMNSLEVIGDNTFLPLKSLKSLNLEGNKIQMLDEKAFNGLSELQSLSLARNKLVDIDNVKIFEGMTDLIMLSLRGNQIRDLKTEVMAPIISNFYRNTSTSLDLEDNNFTCSCRLEWSIALMHKVVNNHLKLALENLKCLPDSNLREAWMKTVDTEKNSGKVFDGEENEVQNSDYEYYDESQLNGTLFYADVRELLNCTGDKKHVQTDTKADEIKTSTTTSEVNKITTTTVSTTGAKPVSISTTEYRPSKITNQGLLDLSVIDTTTAKVTEKVVTTTKLVTVSAKPDDAFDHMASDEAKPDKIKAHRSIQDEVKPNELKGSGHRNACATAVMLLLLCVRLGF
ncbi:hypothetical protein K1T71_008163 [Dendrolimus kikuchii]|uniref:Uncharacterized protein n=1 Tax=Dendrolimus kikuchii TaxID=765133 RepID=A0ACC1CWW4_9NEOP|nr:hypothetical protein K1T71_008163 [Dendrolimus kikuchii]